MSPESSISIIRGVGDALAKKMAVIGVHTVNDLIEMVPRKYEDYTKVSTIASIKPGIVTIKAQIKQARGRYVRRGMHLTEAVASDETGSVRIIWFNQPYRAVSLLGNHEYYIRGDFSLSRQRLSIMNPTAELVKDFPIHTARIIPVYRTTKGLKSSQIRKILKEVIDIVSKMPETLPDWLIKEHHLMSRHEAVQELHFPSSTQQLQQAQYRFGFEEVFRLTLASLLNKYENSTEKPMHVPFDEKLAKSFVSHLPFKLTDDQRRVIWQILLDMQADHPMNRLVEGDVGSGKTVVAAMAAVMALQAGFQVLFMAPTEILAQQHAASLSKILDPLGYASQLGLLIGSLSTTQKKILHSYIKAGDVRFLIGTHALFQDKVVTQNVGLVIIDEQHRFGVEQRKKLQSKAGSLPHVLALTATPIPRSLALTLYGELDISLIKTKPSGRQHIATEIVSPNSVKQLYKTVSLELEAGRQAFIVCPTIIDNADNDIKSVEQVFEEVSKTQFKSKRVGLLHGQMAATAKEDVMNAFRDHKLDILVATTVIEVGVDVPNATVMIIQSAERFGLAQIHQLRGRVGRGEHKGFCYLVPTGSTPNRRLEILTTSNDGFKLAELDLELRGPGAIYGSSQHGELDLRVAKLNDTKLIADSRQAAQEFINRGEKLLNYQELHERVAKLRAITNLN